MREPIPAAWTMPEPTREASILALAENCNVPGPWVSRVQGKHGYPQEIVGNKDGLNLIAQTYSDPDFPPAEADYFAALDPQTIASAMRVIQAARMAQRELRNRDNYSWGSALDLALRAWDQNEN